MIIGITGSTKVGKSTFVSDFIKTYPKYGTPAETYRDIPNLDLYEKGTQESQGMIRDYMFKQAKDIWHRRDSDRRVIHDRTLLDNLACTMFLYAKGGIIDDTFLAESMMMTKQAMSFYHLVYFIPITKHDTIPVPKDVDKDFRTSVDTILKTMYYAYKNRDPLAGDIFPDKNCTAIEEVVGNAAERMLLVGEILDENGDVMGGLESTDTPELLGADGLPTSMDGIDSEFSVEDFGFDLDENQATKTYEDIEP